VVRGRGRLCLPMLNIKVGSSWRSMETVYFTAIVAQEVNGRRMARRGGWSARHRSHTHRPLVSLDLLLSCVVPIPQCCCYSFIEYGWFHRRAHLFIWNQKPISTGALAFLYFLPSTAQSTYHVPVLQGRREGEWHSCIVFLWGPCGFTSDSLSSANWNICNIN
jgi:hypothetical protein